MKQAPFPENCRTVLELVSDGVVMIERETLRLLDANTAFKNLSGYSHPELLRITFKDLCDSTQFMDVFQQVLEGQPVKAKLPIRKKSGKKQQCQVVLYCSEYEDERLIAVFQNQYVGASQIAQKLERQNQELQKINQLKSEFVANISHELRTPLTTILGWPEIILDTEGKEPEVSLRAAQAIQKDGQHLLSLLEDIIDLSKIEAGQLQLEVQYENLNEVVTQAASMIKELAGGKQIVLDLYLQEEIPLVKLDPVRITQVILNFLSNAVKFTSDYGHIAIHTRQDERQVIVEIKDNGIGIQETDQKMIFERFTQVDGSSTRHSGGSGLGLSLARSFILLHGGKVWVNSELGKGSSFYFSLPLLPLQSESGTHPITEPPNNHSQPPGNWPEHPLKILLVDDREDILAVIRAMLLSDRISVFDTTSTNEAIELARKNQPDCILLDIAMPDQPGENILKQLRSSIDTQNIPVIALTAFAMKGDRERFLNLGYDAYLAKPCRKKDLLDCIRQVLEKNHVH